MKSKTTTTQDTVTSTEVRSLLGKAAQAPAAAEPQPSREKDKIVRALRRLK